MNFQIPQFIETEDKIVGPLTLRQFLYFAVAGGFVFMLFFFLNVGIWLVFAFFIITAAASFAFIKVNGRPLSVAAISAFNFYWQPRFYLWQRETPSPRQGYGGQEKTALEKIPETRISQTKSLLDNLWNQLKTSKQPIPKREKVIQPAITDRVKSSKERFEMMRKITGEREVARRVDYR